MIDPVTNHVELPVGVLDDPCTPAPVRKALSTWMDLRCQHRDTGQALGEAQRAVEQAETRDTQALADAIRKGTKEPARQAHKARELLEAAELRLRAVERAIRDAFSAVTAAIDAHAGKWREALEQAEADHRRAWMDAIDGVVLGEQRVRATLTTRLGWASSRHARRRGRPRASPACRRWRAWTTRRARSLSLPRYARSRRAATARRPGTASSRASTSGRSRNPTHIGHRAAHAARSGT